MPIKDRRRLSSLCKLYRSSTWRWSSAASILGASIPIRRSVPLPTPAGCSLAATSEEESNPVPSCPRQCELTGVGDPAPSWPTLTHPLRRTLRDGKWRIAAAAAAATRGTTTARRPPDLAIPGEGEDSTPFLAPAAASTSKAWRGPGGGPRFIASSPLGPRGPLIRVSPTVEFPERAPVEPETSGERGSPQPLCYPIESGLRTFGCIPEDSLPVS